MAKALTAALQVRCPSPPSRSRSRHSAAGLPSQPSRRPTLTPELLAPVARAQNLQRLSQHPRLLQKLGEKKLAFLQEAFPGLGESSDEDESGSDAEWESDDGDEEDDGDEADEGEEQEDVKMVRAVAPSASDLLACVPTLMPLLFASQTST